MSLSYILYKDRKVQTQYFVYNENIGMHFLHR